MPERGFNTEFWADTFVEALPPEGKLLYAYLWTNPHCNQAGLYRISLRRIAYETNLPLEELPHLIESLGPKVKWYPDENLIWVKNFIKHQSKSPKFLIGAASRLKDINNNGAVKELLEYNLKKYSISIPYTYSMDSVCISDSDTHSNANASAKSNADSEELGVVGEEEAVEKKTSSGKDKSKRTFGEAANVHLTTEEYDKLVERLGLQAAQWWIDELSLAKGARGYKSQSDYLTILSWERRAQRQKGGAGGADKRHTGSGPVRHTAAEAKAQLKGAKRDA